MKNVSDASLHAAGISIRVDDKEYWLCDHGRFEDPNDCDVCFRRHTRTVPDTLIEPEWDDVKAAFAAIHAFRVYSPNQLYTYERALATLIEKLRYIKSLLESSKLRDLGKHESMRRDTNYLLNKEAYKSGNPEGIK